MIGSALNEATIAAQATVARERRRRYIFVTLNIIMVLPLIVAEAVILGFSGSTVCNQPLNLFLKVSISNSCLYIFTSTLVLLSGDASNPIRNAAVTVLVGSNVFAVIITVFGTIWVLDSSASCRESALWVMSALLVALGYLQALVSGIIITTSCYLMYNTDRKSVLGANSVGLAAHRA
eukprot:TRINITY_DN4416_c0_g2_i1.p1 TRINITY_DN4416_c0_g2~~TRINITY_DN4416_c0_g2_i1.p1  ORF type:complete len:178 (-),score=31.54 TRINITY_DN4416_c0_g2_i1:565-1098(-)